MGRNNNIFFFYCNFFVREVIFRNNVNQRPSFWANNPSLLGEFFFIINVNGDTIIWTMSLIWTYALRTIEPMPLIWAQFETSQPISLVQGIWKTSESPSLKLVKKPIMFLHQQLMFARLANSWKWVWGNYIILSEYHKCIFLLLISLQILLIKFIIRLTIYVRRKVHMYDTFRAYNNFQWIWV